MRTSSCQIEFVDGAKATIRCGKPVVCGMRGVRNLDLLCFAGRSVAAIHSAITAMTTM